VLQGIRELAQNGYREVVLTGIHLGAYGLDMTPPTSLTALVKRIDSGQLIPRLRIGSVEPNEITDELLTLLADSAILCPHLHLPLQSGSDSVLARMGRQYDASSFSSLMDRIRTLLPHAFIGADVIAGFPGESEGEFNETLEMVRRLPFSDLHIFPYSKRSGTRAAEMPGQLPPQVIKDRAGQLRSAALLKRSAFLQSQINRELPVLIQGYDSRTGMCNGISRNYVNVTFPGQAGHINTERSVLVTAVDNDHVIGVAT
jgi:threonylcarbamoyladenosine tRNA methylthiotransferase MtaB